MTAEQALRQLRARLLRRQSDELTSALSRRREPQHGFLDGLGEAVQETEDLLQEIREGAPV